MSSLADLPELVGFFSYSREDDADSLGALSALRTRIQGELRGQLGRTAKTFRLWQDKEAIPSGTLWETEIKNAVAQSVFFIPIITPTVVASRYCRFELESFLAREAALGRSDLVFPILYIDVPALEDSARRHSDPVLSLIAKRQYVDWREFRYLDVNSTEVRREVGRFCAHIRDALHRPWISPEERKQQEESAAQQRAEEERRREEAEVNRRAEEARWQSEQADARERAEEERRKREAEAERQSAEAERQKAEKERHRKEAEAKRRAEEEERRRLQSSAQTRPAWQPSRPVLFVASLIVVVVFSAIGVWLAATPTHVPVTPTPPAPVTPGPAPGTPTQATETALSPQQELALKPKDTFKECSNCPQMIVVPAGTYTMGSPANEPERSTDEGPQHTVTFVRKFAVGRFALTFDEWDACVADGGCNGYRPSDQGFGRGRQPVIYVAWDDAKAYVAWLSKKTGKTYRLLSEAEREYATRAGTTTPFWWGSSISSGQANYNGNYIYGNGTKGEYRARTMPVDSFAPNPWGLYQVHGNVWDWTEDCYHDSYNGAPADGSAWISGDCSRRVLRGGSWTDLPQVLRSADRNRSSTDLRYGTFGIRVGRTLITP